MSLHHFLSSYILIEFKAWKDIPVAQPLATFLFFMKSYSSIRSTISKNGASSGWNAALWAWAGFNEAFAGVPCSSLASKQQVAVALSPSSSWSSPREASKGLWQAGKAQP